MSHYSDIIEALKIMDKYKITECGGEHDKWNVLVFDVSEEDDKKIKELGWSEGQDGWTYSCWT